MKSSRIRILLMSVLSMAAMPALAHHPMGGKTPSSLFEGMASGIGHPVIGMDHLAFLVVAVLLAFTIKSKSRYLVPAAFVAATVLGTMVHLSAADIPYNEALVAFSVIMGSVLVLARKNLTALVIAAMFGVVGIFHGYAYGEAIVGAENTPLLAYLAGFSLVQYGVIIGGMLLMDKLAKKSATFQSMAVKAGGVLTLLSGSTFLALSLM